MHHRLIAMKPIQSIKDARRRAQLTQAELAVKAAVGLATVQRHEKAGTWPAVKLARRIARALGARITQVAK
jgi:DNA-binding XRE family transcriptional regulator